MDVKKNEISAHDILRFLPLRHILRLSFRQLHTFQIKATVFQVFVPDLKSTQRENNGNTITNFIILHASTASLKDQKWAACLLCICKKLVKKSRLKK